MRWYTTGRTWRVAKAIETLAHQLEEAWPARQPTDGTVGDLSHQARTSDHNPNGYGVVTAIDVGIVGDQGNQLVQAVVSSRDPRVKYIIHRAQIWRAYDKPGLPAWTRAAYTGSNPHNTHVHISVSADPGAYDDPSKWAIGSLTIPDQPRPPAIEETENIVTKLPTLELYDGMASGRPQYRQHVRMAQALLAIAGVVAANTFDAQHRPDGKFGTGTQAAAKRFQTANSLTSDGIIGEKTWAALLEID